MVKNMSSTALESRVIWDFLNDDKGVLSGSIVRVIARAVALRTLRTASAGA